MEIDEDDCLILQDESEGEFGFKIKTDPDKTIVELCQKIDDFVGNAVEPEPTESKPFEPEQKTKYGFKVKKRVQAPVPILRSLDQQNPDGSYTFGYESGDGTYKIETR